MIPTTRPRHTAVLSERLLITRFITGLGLAILLMLGVAAAGHLETNGSTPVPLGMNALLDPHVESMSDDSAGPSPVGEHQAVAEHSSGTGALMGAALCILGVLCGLVFAVLFHRLWRRRLLPDRGQRPRALSVLALPLTLPRTNTLSLTQLSISRT